MVTVLVVMVSVATGGEGQVEVEGMCCGQVKSCDWIGSTPFESELLEVEREVKKERRVEVLGVLRRLAVDNTPRGGRLLKMDPERPPPTPPSPLCTVTSSPTAAVDDMNADNFVCLPIRREVEIDGHCGEATSLSPPNSATMGQ